MENINKELLANITVLYIEDEDIIREQITYFFKRFVKKFYTGKNGLEGIEICKEIRPDIIITDIQMPKMNGLDMIKALDLPDVPVIVTTAYSDIEYFLKAIELNINKYVIKPIDLIELVTSVQECISSSRLRDTLYEKENLLRIVDENVLMSITNKEGIIIDVSHAFCRLTGYSKSELLGNSHSILRDPDTPEIFYKQLWSKILSGEKFTAEIRNRKKDGEIYWANLTITPVYKDNEIINFTAIRQDITNKKKLEVLAIQDELTGLYNRRYFNKIIEKEIRRVKREDSSISLLCLDIDYFKKYNDTFGHPAGDEVLRTISDALKSYCARSTDYVFRMGGEEFCVIFSGNTVEESFEYAQELIRKISKLAIKHTDDTVVTISAGLVTSKVIDTDDEKALYKYADDALYEAKQNGRNQVVLSKKSK